MWKEITDRSGQSNKEPLEHLHKILLPGEDLAGEINPKASHCHKKGYALLAGSVPYKATVAIR